MARTTGAAATTATDPLHRLTAHRAAVKALAWCPFQSNLLASGGGTADRCIKFWNTHTGACLNSIDTHSQVCALQWSQHDKELVSSHGYSHNQLILWKYPSMVKVAELTGHTSRVLHMAQSPDGTTVCSAAADETLRFWRILGSDAAGRRSEGARARAIAIDIPVVGLDFLVPNVEDEQYVIIEANERPGLANHEPQPTAERFVDLLFPKTVAADATRI